MEPIHVFIVWAALALLVVLGYFYFVLTTRQPAEGEAYYQAVGRLRAPLFVLMLLVLGTLFAFTIPRVPYPKGQIPAAVVHVVSKQFQFALSNQPIRTEEEFNRAMGQLVRVPQGQWVEFRVTSLDVNHGFAVYAPSNKLVGQTQAMPGYVNRLFLQLDEPGTYTVLCLEYCGPSHHIMRASFEVVEPTTLTSAVVR